MYCSAKDDILPLINQDKVKRYLDLDDGGTIDEKIIEPYIRAAGYEIDTVLGAFYRVPITGEQSLLIIKGLCIGLTLGQLYGPNTDGNVPERIRTKVERAQTLLDEYGTDPKKFLSDAPRQNAIGLRSNAPLDVDRMISTDCLERVEHN